MSCTNKEKIEKKIDSFIKKNKKEYILISNNQKYSLIGKRKRVTVKSVNENNIFQPVESLEDLMYVVLFATCVGKYDDKEVKKLLEIGCPFIMLNSSSNIKESFDKI